MPAWVPLWRLWWQGFTFRKDRMENQNQCAGPAPASQRYTLHITQTRAGHVSVDAGASFFLNDIDIDGFGLTSPGTEESDEVQIRIAAASEPGVVETK